MSEIFLPDSEKICGLNSLSNNEQLFATAPRTDFWILLEYFFPIGRKALQDSDIPAEVKSKLDELSKSVPYSRLVLIRNSQRSAQEGIHFFLADCTESGRRLYGRTLSSYEALLDLDLPALAKDVQSGRVEQMPEPLFLVCTNGKRDPCCARLGILLHHSLSESYPGQIWETSHVGGHRFAPNLICLPHGIYYGRVDPAQAALVLDQYRTGNFVMQYYRGRACYPPEAQAGESFLRGIVTVAPIEALVLTEASQTSPDHWSIAFSSTLDATKYVVKVEAYMSDFEVFDNCRTPDERSPRKQYRLEEWSKQ